MAHNLRSLKKAAALGMAVLLGMLTLLAGVPDTALTARAAGEINGHTYLTENSRYALYVDESGNSLSDRYAR
ncbi:MAG: hypothetical protein J6B43_03680 [Lachnospiraceae bacterium]|nr:hypothetical protein [Lachnospiraceae bacterium]